MKFFLLIVLAAAALASPPAFKKAIIPNFNSNSNSTILTKRGQDKGDYCDDMALICDPPMSCCGEWIMHCTDQPGKAWCMYKYDENGNKLKGKDGKFEEPDDGGN